MSWRHYVLGMVIWLAPVFSMRVYNHAIESGDYWLLLPALAISILFWFALDLFGHLRGETSP